MRPVPGPERFRSLERSLAITRYFTYQGRLARPLALCLALAVPALWVHPLAAQQAAPAKRQPESSQEVPTFRDDAIVTASAEPVTPQEIEAALADRVDQHVLSATIADRGVSFQYTPDLGRAWRSQGATAELLAAVATATVTLPSLPEDFSLIEVARAKDYNESNVKGRLDLRLHVDDAVEVRLQGERIMWRRLAGSAGTNAGTETTQPFPMGPLRSLNVVKRDGRGQFVVMQQPTGSNGYEMRLRIYDPKGGSDRYHLRIDWEHFE